MQSNRMRWQFVFSSFFFVLCQIRQISYGLFLVPLFIYRANFVPCEILQISYERFSRRKTGIYFSLSFLSRDESFLLWEIIEISYECFLYLSFSPVGNNTNFSPKKNWRLIFWRIKIQYPCPICPFSFSVLLQALNAGK